jgi:hypothetical protein
VQWVTNIGLSTLIGTVLGLVVGIGFGNPVVGLILGLVVGIAFDLRARTRRSNAPPE